MTKHRRQPSRVRAVFGPLSVTIVLVALPLFAHAVTIPGRTAAAATTLPVRGLVGDAAQRCASAAEPAHPAGAGAGRS